MNSIGNLRSRLDCLFDHLRQATHDLWLNARMGACMYDGWPLMSLNARFRAYRLKPCRTKKHQSEC
jgi:hypothetical protein